MKRLLATISLVIFSYSLVSAQATRVVCDDTCKTESGATAIKGDGFANYYANPGSNPEERHPIRNWRGHLTRTEGATMTPTPVWYDTPDSEMMTIPAMKEDMTAFIITGDESRNKVQTMPGGGFETVYIELPRNWNTLMQEKGYKPIEEYYIK